jgi:hypothetical protein
MSTRVASKSSAIPVQQAASPALLIPALLLCISGAAALVYQVLWIKQLSLVVGVEVYAITTGISAFLPGWRWVAGCSDGGLIACSNRCCSMQGWKCWWLCWVSARRLP